MYAVTVVEFVSVTRNSLETERTSALSLVTPRYDSKLFVVVTAVIVAVFEVCESVKLTVPDCTLFIPSKNSRTTKLTSKVYPASPLFFAAVTVVVFVSVTHPTPRLKAPEVECWPDKNSIVLERSTAVIVAV